MDPRTEKALLRSIEHWAKNEQALRSWEPVIRPDDCALCDLFHDRDCKGCPVNAVTGRQYCGGTPYLRAHCSLMDWREADRNDFICVWRAREEFKNRARDMRQFLEGLLCGATSDK